MARRPRIASTAAVVVAGLLLSGCAAQDSSAGERVGDVAAQGYVSGDGTTTIVAPADRKPAPALAGRTLDGGDFVLADHRGQVVVVNVWASWCAPCRSEAADLATVARELGDEGVQFVGINTRDSAAPAAAFVERFGLPYPSIVDPDGAAQLLFRENLPPSAIPSTLVIDREGRIAARAIGEVDRSRLLGLIEPILAGGPGATPAPDPASPASGSAAASGSSPEPSPSGGGSP